MEINVVLDSGTVAPGGKDITALSLMIHAQRTVLLSTVRLVDQLGLAMTVMALFIVAVSNTSVLDVDWHTTTR